MLTTWLHGQVVCVCVRALVMCSCHNLLNIMLYVFHGSFIEWIIQRLSQTAQNLKVHMSRSLQGRLKVIVVFIFLCNSTRYKVQLV